MQGSILLLQSLVAIAAASPIAAAHGTSIDYIIVGGGPAGFVLAEQLSRDPRTQVVLLEAGPDGINSSMINTPAYYPLITEYYWNYTAQPDPNLGGRTASIAQGRVFGGGTAVNGMAYCRGSASVFNEWATLSGNPGLAWDSLLEDFKATSHYANQPADYTQFSNVSAYGNGPLEVSQTSGLTGFDLPFAQAVESTLGLQEIDMTDGTGIGFDLGLSSISAISRTRSYARNTFGSIIERERRPNVRLIHSAWVSHIGFSGHTAVNVTFVSSTDNATHTIAAREIIVSSGAINTPKLLMLSGIGPKDRLSELGIPVVADMPEVGANLRDHAFAVVELEVTDEVSSFWQWSENATAQAIAKEEYATNRSGPLGWGNGYAYAAFRLPDSVWEGVNGSHYTALPEDRPHVLIEYSTVPFMATPNVSVVTAWASLVQPEAAGSVMLRSSDFRDDPLISLNYYGSDADKAAIVAGYKKLREVLSADELKPLITREFYPGANTTADKDVWAAIQQQSFSFRHPVGSVAIGKALDSNWRVKGLKGIRVVDSSTFPTPPTCHPQADVYALAHRAAKDIRHADAALGSY
ncbi:choline dehydrogenase [Macrophomina phaseolina]|uniref:Choline dehydrogenase n=1 Tax=Macrophomina phaseolina TaxID=35725 RepID=A0ABQ8FR13_9PEZI|nr:choline dehydrogenase [Macrophomina phaseolina]